MRFSSGKASFPPYLRAVKSESVCSLAYEKRRNIGAHVGSPVCLHRDCLLARFRAALYSECIIKGDIVGYSRVENIVSRGVNASTNLLVVKK